MRKRCRLPEDDCATEREMQAARIQTLEEDNAVLYENTKTRINAQQDRVQTLEGMLSEAIEVVDVGDRESPMVREWKCALAGKRQ